MDGARYLERCRERADLAWLFSMTAMIVLSWSRGVRDRLKSSSRCAMGRSIGVASSDDGDISPTVRPIASPTRRAPLSRGAVGTQFETNITHTGRRLRVNLQRTHILPALTKISVLFVATGTLQPTAYKNQRAFRGYGHAAADCLQKSAQKRRTSALYPSRGPAAFGEPPRSRRDEGGERYFCNRGGTETFSAR